MPEAATTFAILHVIPIGLGFGYFVLSLILAWIPCYRKRWDQKRWDKKGKKNKEESELEGENHGSEDSV
jgi:preprotein translocase subunit SecG